MQLVFSMYKLLQWDLSELFKQRIVIIDPFLNVQSNVIFRTVAYTDDDLLNTGVNDHTFAHGTAHGICQKRVVFSAAPGQIDRGTNHVSAGSGDDGVGLSMNTSAKLVPLTRGNVHRLSRAFADIRTIESSTRGTVVPSGDDLVITNDDGTVLSSQTGGTLGNGICNIQIVINLART